MAWWKELFDSTTEAKSFLDAYEKVKSIYEERAEELKQAYNERKEAASLGRSIEAKARGKRKYSDEDLAQEVIYDEQRSEAELEFKNAKMELAKIVGDDNIDYVVNHIISGTQIQPEKLAQILKPKALELESKAVTDDDYHEDR